MTTANANASLLLDFVEWAVEKPRSYAEGMEAWRTSCPRLSIWEDALDAGYVTCRHAAGGGVRIEVTAAGHRFLRENGRARSDGGED